MHANSAKARSNNLGHVSGSRHSLETHCGLQTLEVPLSTICNHVTFFDFILRILSELPRFHQCYNESIMDYRLAHRIRSTSHPVPNLSESKKIRSKHLYGSTVRRIQKDDLHG